MRRLLRTTSLREAGFTLLEIMVVVLIIGIIITFATLSLGNRALDSQLEDEADRLYQLFAVATEDADVQGLELGWHYLPDGYEFLVLNQGTWQPFTAGPLRTRSLPNALYIDLNVDGRAIAPASKGEKTSEPQVLLLSSGESSPFRLDLHAHGYRPYIRVEGDALGRLSRKRFEE